mmetsp:Transcript_11508/g.28664  ORF Transcript_11508/g.28664 Transcript_11508/m.28664 type:complete len:397 (+) Transcript_11508:34-1224(+)
MKNMRLHMSLWRHAVLLVVVCSTGRPSLAFLCAPNSLQCPSAGGCGSQAQGPWGTVFSARKASGSGRRTMLCMTLAKDRFQRGQEAPREWEEGYLGLGFQGGFTSEQMDERCAWLSGDAWKEHSTTFGDILTAKRRLKDNALVTDCILQQDLSRATSTQLYLKKEYQQYTGAFKERGARNVLEELLERSKCGGVDVRDKGVVAASAGNHALGLTYHGGKMGIPVTVVMPLGAPMTKVNRCKAMGARVIQHGETFGEAKEYAMTCDQLKGVPYIDPFNDPWVMAGAGTIGLEILDQVPDVDAVVVPVGGAGLIAGLSLAIKTRKPEVAIIGAEPESAASLTAAMKQGRPTDVDVCYTVADGLSVPKIGQKVLARCDCLCDLCRMRTSHTCHSCELPS